MSKCKFKKGARVVVVELNPYDRSIGIKIGDTGVVLQDDDRPYVRMDKFNKKLSNAYGLCEDGHGHWFYEDQLELENKRSLKKLLSIYQYKRVDGVRFVRLNPWHPFSYLAVAAFWLFSLGSKDVNEWVAQAFKYTKDINVNE